MATLTETRLAGIRFHPTAGRDNKLNTAKSIAVVSTPTTQKSANCLVGSMGGNLPPPGDGHDYCPAGSAFQTLRSSKNPSFPETPSSILDLVSCPMPDDLRNAAGLPSRVTRIVSPTVSTVSAYHLPASSFAGYVTWRPVSIFVRSAFLSGSLLIS